MMSFLGFTIMQSINNNHHHNNSSSSTSSTLLPPILVKINEFADSIECSVHTLPKPLLREFRHVFADQFQTFDSHSQSHSSTRSCQLLAIPTNQRAREDLVSVGENVEQEKDRLLNVFIKFGREVCERIRALGYWADYIDPCSGLPMLSVGCNKVYSEVDGMECLLNYRAYNAGFCKVLTHPKWGSAVYPATIFAHAPPEEVIQIIQSYPQSTEE